MPKKNIAPTKSNLIKTKHEFSVAAEGYELLEQKRQILVMELMSYIEKVKRIEKDLGDKIADAYASLKRAITTLGHEDVKAKAQFIKYEFTMRKKIIKMMGMSMPSIEVDTPKPALQYSFLNSNAIVDETSVKFLKLMGLLCQMAEIRNIVWRLSREVKKTQRRVNALEKIVLPETAETIKFIVETLEEKDRDEIFVRKTCEKETGGTIMAAVIKKILVAISGSESSINGAKYAIMLAKTYKWELNVVYVIDTPTLRELLLSKIFIEEESKDYESNLEANGTRCLAYVEELAKSKGVKINRILKKGAVSTMILETAAEYNVDLIVLGSWEQNRAKRDLVTRQHMDILIDAKAPVLMVKEEDIEIEFKRF